MYLTILHRKKPFLWLAVIPVVLGMASISSAVTCNYYLKASGAAAPVVLGNYLAIPPVGTIHRGAMVNRPSDTKLLDKAIKDGQWLRNSAYKDMVVSNAPDVFLIDPSITAEQVINVLQTLKQKVEGIGLLPNDTKKVTAALNNVSSYLNNLPIKISSMIDLQWIRNRLSELGVLEGSYPGIASNTDAMGMFLERNSGPGIPIGNSAILIIKSQKLRKDVFDFITPYLEEMAASGEHKMNPNATKPTLMIKVEGMEKFAPTARRNQDNGNDEVSYLIRSFADSSQGTTGDIRAVAETLQGMIARRFPQGFTFQVDMSEVDAEYRLEIWNELVGYLANREGINLERLPWDEYEILGQIITEHESQNAIEEYVKLVNMPNRNLDQNRRLNELLRIINK